MSFSPLGTTFGRNTSDPTRSKRLQVTRACGLEDEWMFGQGDIDVTMCFSGPPELMQSESVPEWCRQCFLDETSERCTSELQPKTSRFLTCFTTFYALTCVLLFGRSAGTAMTNRSSTRQVWLFPINFPILFASPSQCSYFEEIAV